MNFTFLGTSAGIPTQERNVTALIVQPPSGRDWYLVDCGEGTQHQLLQTPFSLVKLKAIFITHVHGDHCFGLPGLIASAHMQGRREPLTICAPAGIETMIRQIIELCDMSRLRFELNFIASDEPGFQYQDERVCVNAFELSHRVPCFAYRFEERLQEADPRSPRRLMVGGDNDRPELLIPAMRAGDVLIHEATFSQAVLEAIGPVTQHSSALQVAKAAEAAGISELVLTHFSQRYSRRVAKGPHSMNSLRVEAKKAFNGKLHLARDFEYYRIEADKSLSCSSIHELASKPKAAGRKA